MVTKKTTSRPKAAKKTAVKPAGVTKLAVKPAPKLPAKPAAKAAVAAEATPVVKIVRRKELVERVSEATGLRPNQIKPAMDGLLAEIGKLLSAGEGLNVPPLGKMTVNRRKEVNGREIMVCKLRRNMEGTPAKTPLDTSAE